MTANCRSTINVPVRQVTFDAFRTLQCSFTPELRAFGVLNNLAPFWVWSNGPNLCWQLDQWLLWFLMYFTVPLPFNKGFNPWSMKSQFILFNLIHNRGSSIYVYKSCSKHIVPYFLQYTIKKNKGTQSNHQTCMHIPKMFTKYPTLIYSYSSISQGMRILIYYKWQPSN